MKKDRRHVGLFIKWRFGWGPAAVGEGFLSDDECPRNPERERKDEKGRKEGSVYGEKGKYLFGLGDFGSFF